MLRRPLFIQVFQAFLIYGGKDTRSSLQLFCRQLCRVIFDPFDGFLSKLNSTFFRKKEKNT